MKPRYLLLGVAVLCGLVIAMAVRRASAPERFPASEPAAQATAANELTPPEVPLPKKPDEKTLARVSELGKMEVLKRQREQAAEKTRESRLAIQLYRHRAWTEVIQAYQPEFEILRAAAAQSPKKKVPCAICGAKGILDLCVVCDHTGECPTCHGTGKHFDGICPTCVGSGKCFLCFGSGKMACPFCQSRPLSMEMITPGTPDPPTDLPINELTPSPPPGVNRGVTP